MTNGIVTYADTDFLESAKLLAITAKKFSNLPTTLVTNQPIEADEFEHIIVTPCRYAEEGMIVSLMASPYDNTAFIYADSLVLSNITPYFAMLEYQDFVFANARDFKSAPLPSALFLDRNMITKNSLPDVWTNFFLYKKEPMQEVTSLMSTVMELWKDILPTACPNYSNDDYLKLHFNTVMSIALKTLDKKPADYGLPFVNMSMQTANVSLSALAEKPWHQLLSYWVTDEAHVKVENYIQQGVWHYATNFIDQSKQARIRQICSI